MKSFNRHKPGKCSKCIYSNKQNTTVYTTVDTTVYTTVDITVDTTVYIAVIQLYIYSSNTTVDTTVYIAVHTTVI